jgi:hypothetical protein
MEVGLKIFACVSTAAGLVASLMILVLCLAGTPNSTPEQLATMKAVMLGVVVGGLLFFAGGVTLLVLGRPGWSAVVGGAPAAVAVVGLVWLTVATVR